MRIFNAHHAKLAMTLCVMLSVFNAAHAVQEVDTKVAQAQKLPNAKVSVTMRDSGYTMGDFMQMQVVITLADKQKLDPDSLPLVGRMKPWLDLREIKMRAQQLDGKNQTILDITWQLFATVAVVDALKTPEIVVSILDDATRLDSTQNQNKKTEGQVATYTNSSDAVEKTSEAAKSSAKKVARIIIPATNFYVSPTFAAEVSNDIKRYPNLPPLRFDEHTPSLKAALLIGFSVLCGVLLLWLKDLIPWLPRRPGPITQLARKYKKQPPTIFQVENLREIHVALNASAGHTLYPKNLKSLFERAPYLVHEQAAITQFVEASWGQFYGNESFVRSQSANLVIDKTQTLQWIQRASTAERLFRRQPKLKPHRKSVTKPKLLVQLS
jgi:hypothetical protein